MADTTDPKTDDAQGQSAQGGAFGGVPFDEVQKKKDTDAGFSLDMDDLPDLDDISLDLDDDAQDKPEDTSTDDSGLDATGDVLLDDINLDDINLDDISLDSIVGSESSETPTDSSTVDTTPPASVPEVNLSDLYKKPVEPETASKSAPTIDLGDLVIPTPGSVEPAVTNDEVATSVSDKSKKEAASSSPAVSTQQPASDSKANTSPDDTTSDQDSDLPTKKKSSALVKKTPETSLTTIETPTDTVAAAPSVAPIKKIDIPLGSSKVVKKFIEVLNVIREGSVFNTAGEAISVVGIHTDKQHIVYNFTHSDNKSFQVERKASDPSTDEEIIWQLVMSYNDATKGFDLTLDDVEVYTETGDVVSDKSLQHTVVDKLSKFALLLSEFVRKEKKQQEELLRLEEEKKKQREVAKKLRDF